MRPARWVLKARLSFAAAIALGIGVFIPHVASARHVRYLMTCTDGDGSVFGRYPLPESVCDSDGQADGTCTFQLSSCDPCGLGPYKCPSCPTAPVATIPIPVGTTRVINLFDFVHPPGGCLSCKGAKRLFRLRCRLPAGS